MEKPADTTTITFPPKELEEKVRIPQAAPYWKKDARKRQRLARRMTRKRREGKQT